MEGSSLINNFSGGELGQSLFGRFELPAYKTGLARCHNFLPLLQGVAKFRPGFEFILRSRKNQIPWFIPFIFNDEQAYILNFIGDELSFLDDNGAVLETAQNITGITVANPGVITITSHGFSDDDEVFVTGIGGTMDELNGRFFTVDNATTHTFTLVDIFGNAVDTTGLTYVSGGTAARVYAIDSVYSATDLSKIQIAQEADVAYLVDGYHEPQKLSRLGTTNWTLNTFDRTNDPFLTASITAITKANPGVITTSADHGLVDDEIVHLRSIGGMTELNDGTYQVVVASNTTFSLKTLAGSAVDTTSYTTYTSGGKVFSADDQPSAVGLYGGRVFYGGPARNPDGLYGSRGPTDEGVKRYEDFTVGTDASHGVRFFISSTGNTLERIEWFAGSSQFLGVGGLSDVYKVTGSEGDGYAITGTSIDAKPTGSLGVASIPPTRLGPSIFYVERGRLVLNSFEYDLYNDGYTSIDQNILNPEITKNKLKQLAFQRGTPDFIWSIDDVGNLLSLTYKATESISAWARHKIAGTDSKVLTLAVEPQADGQDNLWIAVERTINSQTVRYIEKFAKDPVLPERFDYFSVATKAGREADDFQWSALMLEQQATMVRCDSALSTNGLQSVGLTLSATSGTSVTVTAASPLFTAADVDKTISMKYITGEENGVARIHTYNSTTEVLAEVTETFDSTSVAANAWYLSFNQVEGFWHLEGETMALLGDGGEVPSATVTDGVVSLGGQYSRFVGGLSYDGILETLPINVNTQFGNSFTKTLTINEIGIYYLDTMTLNFGRDRYSLEELYLRTTIDYNSFPVILKSGEERKPAKSYNKRNLQYVVGVSSPNIATVGGLAFYTSVGDEG